ncbi:ABC-2 type transport system permease protein [Anaerocolumna jejuensis DSM 15929]|uniref:ABC-2 type transport system permease protein n=1 Tax=Anaerocolumna jejuensis DSM 15929 TaxID=1121322 RepID=A0A1M6PN96_9FIRM|nr:ABC transporter permease [Anaerocolumna jejuensis]SHK09436.1 ABC-2 type transport system permease protein [Anaerocolumna jejuensis DSM 15929]
MPWALIKNNFKLMFRNKWVIILMLVGPVFVIASLSSAFKAMLTSYTPADTFTAGYSLEAGSSWEGAMASIKEAAKENKIELREFSLDGTSSLKSVEDIFQRKEAAVFVEFNKGSYHIYKQKDMETEAGVMEYFLHQVVQSLKQADAGVGNGNGNGDRNGTSIRTVSLNTVPKPDSTDYYGIIYIVYFSWCSIIIMSPVFSSERKNRIVPRLKASPLSSFSLYLGKVLPCISLTMLLTFSSAALNTLLFGIKWGRLPGTLLVMACSVIAAALFSIFIYYLFGNMAVTVGVIFTLVWVAGFLGGSFETYFYSAVSDRLKELSPLYYINRTLVEYSTMGRSDYGTRCLLYLAVISITAFVGGLLLADGRGRKNQ